MEYRENPKFGRKVFFLNPPLSIENGVLDLLKSKDYEVYVIRDYGYAKAVLRTYENAICFIYIDDVLSQTAWFNFIKSFENDETLKTVFLGILSVKTKLKDQENFLMNLKLPGGFVMLDKKVEKVAEQIEGILEINGAKGIRKCIRLDLKDSNDVNGYFAYGSLLYSFRLVDISRVGFAAVIPAKTANIFTKGSVINNVSITMGRYSFVCSVTVFNTTISGDTCTVVALLDEKTPVAINKKINDFIYEVLERRHLSSMNSMIRDFTDYSAKSSAGTTEENTDEEAALAALEPIDDEEILNNELPSI